MPCSSKTSSNPIDGFHCIGDGETTCNWVLLHKDLKASNVLMKRSTKWMSLKPNMEVECSIWIHAKFGEPNINITRDKIQKTLFESDISLFRPTIRGLQSLEVVVGIEFKRALEVLQALEGGGRSKLTQRQMCMVFQCFVVRFSLDLFPLLVTSIKTIIMYY
jgi:hypothetical protein